MMFNRDVRRKKGFSLIELLVVMVITLVLVGVAAMYLEEYVYKGKVSKAMQDLDMFRSALQLHDATEQSPFMNYNYQGGGDAATFGFAYSTLGIAGYDAIFATLGGADVAWTNYSANSLKDLLGKYLLTLPTDPFGGTYVVNSSAGYVASLGADQSTASNVGRNKDLLMYYLNEIPVLVDVVVNDNDASGTITANDYIDFKFNKDVTGPDTALAADDFIYTDENLNIGADVTVMVLGNATANFGGAVRVKNDGRTLRYVVDVAPAENLVGKKIKFKSTSTAAVTISDNNPYYRNTTSGKARVVSLTNGNPYVKVRLAGTF